MPIKVLFLTSGNVIREVKIVKKQKIPFDDGQDYFKSLDYGVQIHLGYQPNSTRFNFGVFTKIGLRNIDGGAPKRSRHEQKPFFWAGGWIQNIIEKFLKRHFKKNHT